MPVTQNDLTVNSNANGTTQFILNLAPFGAIQANGVTVVDDNPVGVNRFVFSNVDFRSETMPATPYRLLISMTTTRPAGAVPPSSGAIRVRVATTNNGQPVLNDSGPLGAKFVSSQNPVSHPPTVPVQTLVYGDGTGEQQIMLPVTGLWGVTTATIESNYGIWTWHRGAQTPGNFWMCVQYTPFPRDALPKKERLPDFRVTLNKNGGGTYLVPDFPVNFIHQD